MTLLVSFLAGILSIFHPPTTPLPKLITPLEHTIQTVSGSVLHLLVEKDIEDMFGEHHVKGTCTGFMIAPRKAMTAAHCIGTPMTADGQPILVLKTNTKLDLAVFLVDSPKKGLVFAPDVSLSRFQQVYGLGYGFGFTRLTVTSHTVMIQGYEDHEYGLPPGLFVWGEYIHGMSGGPVVNTLGQVVGMVQQGREGVGFGVDGATMQAFLK